MFFRTFWNPHELPGVPKGYYDPLWVWAGDMLPKRNERYDGEPDSRKLIRECLENKKINEKEKCLKWIRDNNFKLSDDEEMNNDRNDNGIQNENRKKNIEDEKTVKKSKKLRGKKI